MRRSCMVLLGACLALPVSGIESRDVRGLDVRVESIEGGVDVDGVHMDITRASGRDVETLATRIGQRWQAAGSASRRMEQGAWRMLSRWHLGRVELIQWRSDAAGAELLFSILDPRRQAMSATALPPLPVQCAWGRRMEGGPAGSRYAQRTARCRAPASVTVPALHTALLGSDWTLQPGSGRSLQVARNDVSGLLIVVDGRVPGESWIVWVAAPMPGGRP